LARQLLNPLLRRVLQRPPLAQALPESKEQFESGLLHFVTRIRDRCFVAVDAEPGLVFSLIFFDHSAGKTRTIQTPNGRTVTAGPTSPWTWELAEMFKIEKGKIRRIEAIIERAPYGMNSGSSNLEDSRGHRIL